ncbi:LytTR family DNA-binding domain-containing protein [Lacihabitans sp. CS3-21]|uniref:LytR/AlgR family response regulator transcription factor n=1 Tax=Lacihabitans sp. CS3-21 TaxID=2487332 RepID=UPI0020CFC1BC|nr:LytTR family DNA-binding domain-containing protein [Lacihabitans sp. CS3-21]MCP9745113.1 DNA-binding response regulator [Lacihabitans sp. CS3-21]
MKPITCIIIDDEEIDRLTVSSFVNRCGAFHVVGVFENAFDAIPVLENEKVEVLFLDIDMPNMNGIDFRKIAKDVPICIFITSHPEFAVESFDLDTLDFIVKPLKFDRFTKTVDRIRDYLELKQKANLFEASLGGDVIYIKEGTVQVKIKLHDILYLEALKDYTKIVTETKQHCVLSSLGVLIKDQYFSSFVRVHRSYAIQKHYVLKIQTNDVMLRNEFLVPIGRSFRENLLQLQ